MKIITLDGIPLSEITVCFNEAFSDYFIKFIVTEQYLQQRWKGAGVDFSLSAGVLNNGKLVGFIVNGVRDCNGLKTAYNTGTGVIPSHRGNGLTEKMYQFLAPKFSTNGIESLSLEVIQENKKAIHLYEKVGLKITRGLNSYGGEISVETPTLTQDIVFKKIETPEWDTFKSFYDFEPAWDNKNIAIKTCKELFSFYGVEKNNKLIAFGIVKDKNLILAQFGVHPDFRNQSIGKFLFYHLSKFYASLRIINVDASADGVNNFIKRVGLKNSVNQYEMVSYL